LDGKVSQETNMSTLRLRTLALIFALAGLACLVGAAHAAAPRFKAGGSEHVVKELHHAKHLLEEADHDYHGHRARAVKDVSEAIHELSHGEKHHAGPEAKGGSNGGKEPQKESNHQLREAIEILHHAKKELHHEHHKKALHHVEEAIKQLHEALEVVKK
jgi:hypothetical protein